MTLFDTRINRRRLLAGGTAAAAGLIVAGSRHRFGHAASDSIRLLCWGGYDNPDATGPFQDSSGFGVQADYIGANDEIFTDLRAGGIGRYDIVTPYNGVVNGLVNTGLIQPIDISRLKNAAGLFPRFAQPNWSVVNGQVYAIPFMWRTAPMVYNANRLNEPPAKWTDLTNATFKGKIVMTEDVISHFLTWNRALGASDPARVTIFELNQTVSLLVQIKRDLVGTFIAGQDALAQELAHGRSYVSTTGWDIVPSLPAAKGANLKLARPTPGDFSTCDCLCIPAEAPHLDAAYAFIDQMIAAESQAVLAEALFRGVVTATAVPMLSDEIRGLFAYDDLDEVFSLSPLVGFPPLDDSAPNVATYVDWVVAWDRIRYTPQLALATPTPTRKPTNFLTPRPATTLLPTATRTPTGSVTATATVTPSSTATPTPSPIPTT